MLERKFHLISIQSKKAVLSIGSRFYSSNLSLSSASSRTLTVEDFYASLISKKILLKYIFLLLKVNISRQTENGI